jgi:hypothetical protein
MDASMDDRVSALERTLEIQTAVKTAMDGVSKAVNEAADRSERASREAADRAERASERAMQENAREARNTRWLIIAIFFAAVALMYHETDKSRDMAEKAYEQSVQAKADLNAKTAPAPAPPAPQPPAASPTPTKAPLAAE